MFEFGRNNKDQQGQKQYQEERKTNIKQPFNKNITGRSNRVDTTLDKIWRRIGYAVTVCDK